MLTEALLQSLAASPEPELADLKPPAASSPPFLSPPRGLLAFQKLTFGAHLFILQIISTHVSSGPAGSRFTWRQ